MKIYQKNFTLIELISVIVIVSILSVFAVAKGDLFSHNEAEILYTAKLIRSDIRFVQTLALKNDKQNSLFGLNFSNTGYTITKNGINSSVNFPGTSSPQRTLGDDITLTSNVSTINFDLFGAPTADLTLTVNSANSLTVHAKTGRITETP